MNNETQINTIDLCRAFIAKRPGLYLHNYNNHEAYRADARRINQQLNDARTLLLFCKIAGADIDAQLSEGGRLSRFNDAIYYTTCQYFPTEYRAAVARAAASALWAYWRDVCGIATDDAIRKHAVKKLGRGIASRWFN